MPLNNKISADTALKEFLNDNEIFAALLNGFLFDNEKIIDPNELEPMDSAYSDNVDDSNNQKVVRYRDIVKRTSLGKYVIIGVENQKRIHYAMPVRKMLYDALVYTRQIKEIPKEKIKWTSDEYLSNVEIGTKIEPVVTVVLYVGENKWDGPRSLHEMLEIPEVIKKYVPDYPLYVIDMGHDEMLKFSNKKIQDYKTALTTIINKDKTSTEELDAQMVALAGITTGNMRVYNMVQGKETVNMFTVFEEYETKFEEYENKIEEYENMICEAEAYKSEAETRIKELEAQLAMFTKK